MSPTTLHTDVAIIGGGPAGLQAALTLGRIHRDAVLFDNGTYRNAGVAHMHNVLTHDGTAPSEFRATARDQLAAYDTISVRDVAVTDVVQADGGFRLVLADDSVLTAEVLILATGVRDELPAVDGLDDLWGDLAAHCPFCHGHEFSGRRIGILSRAPRRSCAPAPTSAGWRGSSAARPRAWPRGSTSRRARDS